VFFYSRKPQILLLFCWCLALAAMFVQVTGEAPLSFPWRIVPNDGRFQTALKAPPPVPQESPAPLPAEPPAQAAEKRSTPSADSTLNRATALRIKPAANGDKNVLALELDYIAARKNGFTPEKAHNYYTKDTPTFVIVLGSPWVLEPGLEAQDLNMEQADRVSLWLSEARQLRLTIHTRNVAQAAGARVRLQRTPTGLRAEIHFAR
jgi:hypothetical protein